MNCQSCRTPLKLDPSLQDLNPAAFDLLVGRQNYILLRPCKVAKTPLQVVTTPPKEFLQVLRPHTAARAPLILLCKMDPHPCTDMQLLVEEGLALAKDQGKDQICLSLCSRNLKCNRLPPQSRQ
jgi:hypothetical protein